MTLKYIPENFRKAILDLTKDEEFQKIYAEDKELDQIEEDFMLARDAYIATYNKREQRMC